METEISKSEFKTQALEIFQRVEPTGEPITVLNHRHHKRSFTCIAHIVEGVVRALEKMSGKSWDWDGYAPDPASSGVTPCRIYNIGNEQAVPLLTYIEVLERCLGKKAQMQTLPLHVGDVPDTEADISDLLASIDYRPPAGVADGVTDFVRWYRQFNEVAS